MAQSVLVGQWNTAHRVLGNFEKDLNRAVESAMRIELVDLTGRIKKGIRSQSPGGKAFTELSELTLASREFAGKKGRNKILMVDGDLLGSITWKLSGDAGWVGVNKKAQSEDGTSMSNIAAVHEFGYEPIVIPYTDSVRKYLMAMMTSYGIEPTMESGDKKDVLIISIPARPFLKPVFKVWKKGLDARWKDHIGNVMKEFG